MRVTAILVFVRPISLSIIPAEDFFVLTMLMNSN